MSAGHTHTGCSFEGFQTGLGRMEVLPFSVYSANPPICVYGKCEAK